MTWRPTIGLNLKDVLYVSYILPLSQLRPLVPEDIPLAVIDGNRVFVSVVTLVSENVKLRQAPWPRFNYCQMNLRTYVTDPQTGDPAVYFFRSVLTSWTTAHLASFMGLPWERGELSIETKYDDPDICTRYRCNGNWHGSMHIEARGIAQAVPAIPPFASGDEAVRYLTDPFLGFFGSSGKARKFRVWHPHLSPQLAEVSEIRLPVLVELGLLKEDQMLNPHSVFLVPETLFRIFLPPARV